MIAQYSIASNDNIHADVVCADADGDECVSGPRTQYLNGINIRPYLIFKKITSEITESFSLPDGKIIGLISKIEESMRQQSADLIVGKSILKNIALNYEDRLSLLCDLQNKIQEKKLDICYHKNKKIIYLYFIQDNIYVSLIAPFSKHKTNFFRKEHLRDEINFKISNCEFSRDKQANKIDNLEKIEIFNMIKKHTSEIEDLLEILDRISIKIENSIQLLIDLTTIIGSLSKMLHDKNNEFIY